MLIPYGSKVSVSHATTLHQSTTSAFNANFVAELFWRQRIESNQTRVWIRIPLCFQYWVCKVYNFECIDAGPRYSDKGAILDWVWSSAGNQGPQYNTPLKLKCSTVPAVRGRAAVPCSGKICSIARPPHHGRVEPTRRL